MSRLSEYMLWDDDSAPLVFRSQCDACIHREKGKTCFAYPEGIPKDVFKNTVDHRKPVYGDGGIRFEPRR